MDTKHISAIRGHSRTSFTDQVYVTVFPEVAAAAMDAAAALARAPPPGNREAVRPRDGPARGRLASELRRHEFEKRVSVVPLTAP